MGACGLGGRWLGRSVAAQRTRAKGRERWWWCGTIAARVAAESLEGDARWSSPECGPWDVLAPHVQDSTPHTFFLTYSLCLA